jgi:hypothetical protein
VKTGNPEQGSIYQGEDRKIDLSPLSRLPLLLMALLAAHFLNVFMIWSVTRQELAAKPAYGTPEYTFLGFAPLNRENIDAAQRLPNAAPQGRVFAYFDLFHPAEFMVWNNGLEGDFFDLGPLLVALPSGASRITLLPAGIFLLRQGQAVVVKNYGGSIAGSSWAGVLGKKDPGAGGQGQGITGSFILKQEEGTRFVKFPYLVYFYLPLALIVILIATLGAGMAAAFFYYAGMFFLFDFQRLFVTVPLAPLFRALNVELAEPWVKALAVALALLFLASAVYGMLRWKNSEMPANGRWIVWFFILLPLFLFF